MKGNKMITQKQLCYKAAARTAQRYNDIDYMRKQTALHHVQDGLDLCDAWEIEQDVNRRLRHVESILFPDKETLDRYMSWARAQTY